jgi:glycosyltransferase involved in cell wall biosynthesis
MRSPPSYEVTISVIIPTYNMADFVGGAIDSVLPGHFEDLEVIVVDDGSTDDTQSVVETYTDGTSSRYDERVRYKYQENRGKSVAVNRGLKIARGSYVSMLGAERSGNRRRLGPRSYDALVRKTRVHC